MQGIIISILISVGLSTVIAILWVNGIDNMQKKYPEYKGHDFLDWDDNKTNSEGTF